MQVPAWRRCGFGIPCTSYDWRMLKRRLNAHSAAQFVAGPVLQNFGNKSGTSHLLHAPITDPSRIAITIVQIFCIDGAPASLMLEMSARHP
jgi:hypothetical protein